MNESTSVDDWSERFEAVWRSLDRALQDAAALFKAPVGDSRSIVEAMQRLGLLTEPLGSRAAAELWKSRFGPSFNELALAIGNLVAKAGAAVGRDGECAGVVLTSGLGCWVWDRGTGDKLAVAAWSELPSVSPVRTAVAEADAYRWSDGRRVVVLGRAVRLLANGEWGPQPWYSVPGILEWTRAAERGRLAQSQTEPDRFTGPRSARELEKIARLVD